MNQGNRNLTLCALNGRKIYLCARRALSIGRIRIFGCYERRQQKSTDVGWDPASNSELGFREDGSFH